MHLPRVGCDFGVLGRRCLHVDWYQHTANVNQRLPSSSPAQKPPSWYRQTYCIAQGLKVAIVLLEHYSHCSVVEHSFARVDQLLYLLGRDNQRQEMMPADTRYLLYKSGQSWISE